MSSENLTLYMTIVFYILKLVSLFYSYATCQVLCGCLHLNLRRIYFRKKYFPCDRYEKAGGNYLACVSCFVTGIFSLDLHGR